MHGKAQRVARSAQTRLQNPGVTVPVLYKFLFAYLTSLLFSSLIYFLTYLVLWQ